MEEIRIMGGYVMSKKCPKCGKDVPQGCLICPFCGFDLVNGEVYKEEINREEIHEEEEKDSDPLSMTYKILSYIIAAVGFIAGIVVGNTYPQISSEYKVVFNAPLMLTVWLCTFLVWLGIYAMGRFLEYQHTIVRLLKRADDRAVLKESIKASPNRDKDVILKDETEDCSTAGTT